MVASAVSPGSSPRLTYPEFHYRWEWELGSSPEALWPLVADTNRFNRDTSTPPIQQRATPRQNARRQLRMVRLGVPLEMEEEPFEWVRPYRYGVRRKFSSGPVGEMRILAQMSPNQTGGTHLIYEVWARPRNLLGLIAIPAQVGILSARSFAATVFRYDRLAGSGQPLVSLPAKVEFAPGGRERLKVIRDNLLAEGAQPPIVDQMMRFVETADSLALGRIRPYQLADTWGFDRRAVLEHFLVATRCGLFELQWDVLCPLCRGAKASPPTLGELQSQVHCEVCNIDFDVNFDRSVELTFHINPSVREGEKSEFCIAGPQTTPHVAVQQLMAAGEERVVQPTLEPGRYRLRALALRGGEFIQVTPDGAVDVTLRASIIDGWPEGELQISPTPTLRLKNATDVEQLLILERMVWSDQAVLAAEVTVMQVFRDLFASEALRPGQQISVGSLTVVFTDLRGSTGLYNEIGDAPAFGLVMSHFDVLRDSIIAEGGAIVKTIGDAVMAVFRRPTPAVRAMLAAQQTLSRLEGRPLHLKAGIHFGPCIAVTLNDRLDYFGSTVNMAARLEGFSSGMDIVLSEAAHRDPEVNAWLNEDSSLHASSFDAQLKGFHGQSFQLWRVMYKTQDEVIR
jgi:class 3 adenylate cyclase